MLNRFKSVLYGTGSNPDTLDTGQAGAADDYRESFRKKSLNKERERGGALTRSSSFREDLSTSRRAHNSNSNVGLSRGKSQVFYDVHRQSNGDAYSFFFADDSRTNKATKLPKFRYSRPKFLQLKTDDEILVSADHQVRPIILPRDVSRLPWKSGYAECINAGKSLRNEDQAAYYQDVVVKQSSLHLNNNNNELEPIDILNQMPWIYFGIFDGHAGTAVAIAAANQLHNIVGQKLQHVADLLIDLEFNITDNRNDQQQDDDDDEYLDCKEDRSIIGTNKKGLKDAIFGKETNDLDVSKKVLEQVDEEDEEKVEKDDNDKEEKKEEVSSLEEGLEDKNRTKIQTKEDGKERSSPTVTKLPCARISANINQAMTDFTRNNVTIDTLVTGALESAFWDMDALIADDKQEFKMAGGCTAIVGLFILGKLYVCNAGDSRAIVYKGDQVIPMSFDFTPTSERERILRLGQQRPEFLGTDFTHLEFIKRPTRRDLGKQMLYKDAFMTGWSMKTITYDDLRFPLVWGEGKRSRVLATIGVTRGFGDHELRAQYGSVLIKPFLTPEPEVRVLCLEDDDKLTAEDVLIMGSDGLWDVTTNEEAANIVKSSFDHFPDNEESRSKYRYITAAQDLVIGSRGNTDSWGTVWKTGDDKLASLDDIAVFVVPLKQYRDDYREWKMLRTTKHKQMRDERKRGMANTVTTSLPDSNDSMSQ